MTIENDLQPIACLSCGRSLVFSRPERSTIGAPLRWRCQCGRLFPPVVQPKPNRHQIQQARHDLMRARRDAGATLAEVGVEFNVSRERVRQILEPTKPLVDP
jgi:hypothetical protein